MSIVTRVLIDDQSLTQSRVQILDGRNNKTNTCSFRTSLQACFASDSTETTNARLIDVQSRWCPPGPRVVSSHCVTNCSSFTRGETESECFKLWHESTRSVREVRLQDYILDTVSEIGYHTKFLVDKLRSSGISTFDCVMSTIISHIPLFHVPQGLM
jgi:hypothetical protein